jgi:hypothetical protein
MTLLHTARLVFTLVFYVAFLPSSTPYEVYIAFVTPVLVEFDEGGKVRFMPRLFVFVWRM